MRGRRGGDAAFTLIETMIVVVVLGIIVGAIASAIIVGLRTSDKTVETLTSAAGRRLVTRYLTEDVQTSARQSAPGGIGCGTSAVPFLTLYAEGSPVDLPRVEYQVRSEPPNTECYLERVSRPAAGPAVTRRLSSGVHPTSPPTVAVGASTPNYGTPLAVSLTDAAGRVHTVKTTRRAQ